MKSVAAAAILSATALVLTACSGGGGGGGAEYPERSISVIVPVPAGSSTDLSTRLVVPCLEQELGQTIVVENREGGSGVVGNGQFVRSDADGYTLVSTTAANAVLPEIVQGGVGFSAESFQPVGLLGQAPIVLVTAADAGGTAEDLLGGPSPTLIGIPGATSVPGIVLQSLVQDHDAAAQPVPFDGNAGTIQALVSGEVAAALVSADSGVVMPRIDDGQITAVATAVNEPVDYLPDVPTLASVGYEDLPYADSFWFLAAPPDTPEDIVATLEEATQACMTDEEVTSQLGNAAPTEFIDGAEVSEMLREAEEGYSRTLGATQ